MGHPCTIHVLSVSYQFRYLPDNGFAGNRPPMYLRRNSNALASAMASEGMPIPNIPFADTDRKGRFGKFLTAIASLCRPNLNPISSAMNKTYTFLCAVLGLSAIALTDNNASLSDEQLAKIDNALKRKTGQSPTCKPNSRPNLPPPPLPL